MAEVHPSNAAEGHPSPAAAIVSPSRPHAAAVHFSPGALMTSNVTPPSGLFTRNREVLTPSRFNTLATPAIIDVKGAASDVDARMRSRHCTLHTNRDFFHALDAAEIRAALDMAPFSLRFWRNAELEAAFTDWNFHNGARVVSLSLAAIATLRVLEGFFYLPLLSSAPLTPSLVWASAALLYLIVAFSALAVRCTPRHARAARAAVVFGVGALTALALFYSFSEMKNAPELRHVTLYYNLLLLVLACPTLVRTRGGGTLACLTFAVLAVAIAFGYFYPASVSASHLLAAFYLALACVLFVNSSREYEARERLEFGAMASLRHSVAETDELMKRWGEGGGGGLTR
jgi:hypothetical protein